MITHLKRPRSNDLLNNINNKLQKEKISDKVKSKTKFDVLSEKVQNDVKYEEVLQEHYEKINDVNISRKNRGLSYQKLGVTKLEALKLRRKRGNMVEKHRRQIVNLQFRELKSLTKTEKKDQHSIIRAAIEAVNDMNSKIKYLKEKKARLLTKLNKNPSKPGKFSYKLLQDWEIKDEHNVNETIIRDEDDGELEKLTKRKNNVTKVMMHIGNQATKQKDLFHKNIFLGSRIPIILTRYDGVVLDVNLQMENLVGFNRERLFKLTCCSLVHPQDYHIGRKSRKQVEKNQISDVHNKRILTAKGSYIRVDCRGAGIFRNGELYATMCMMTRSVEEEEGCVSPRN